MQPFHITMRIFTGLATGLTLAAIVVAGLATPAFASSHQTGISMSPAKVTPELKKGQIYKGQFLLRNHGEADIKIKVYASPYEATNDGYKLESTSDRSLLHNWVKFDKSEVAIKAGNSTQISYTINTPNDIPDGGQYGLIFAETINDSPTNTSGITTASRLGMLIYASTDGQNRYQGNLHEVKLPFLNIGSKAEFSFKAKNDGNTHYDVKAKLNISDLFGKSKFNQEKTNLTIVPGIDKKVNFVWEPSPLFALMKVNLQVDGLNQQNINQTKVVLFVSPILIIIVSVIIVILGASYVANKKLQYRYKK